ncbi:hypothetical protein H3Z85_22400 [Chryseobacterium indologenes]|nr:hypothetical protein H3Z85_22400 [Chryseobacterium indologenes]
MMKRRLMMVERIMYVDSKTPLNVIFTARISGQLPEENFRLALDKIQQKHALLRVSIDEKTGQYPFLSNNRTSVPSRSVSHNGKRKVTGCMNRKRNGSVCLMMIKSLWPDWYGLKGKKLLKSFG